MIAYLFCLALGVTGVGLGLYSVLVLTRQLSRARKTIGQLNAKLAELRPLKPSFMYQWESSRSIEPARLCEIVEWLDQQPAETAKYRAMISNVPAHHSGIPSGIRVEITDSKLAMLFKLTFA